MSWSGGKEDQFPAAELWKVHKNVAEAISWLHHIMPSSRQFFKMYYSYCTDEEVMLEETQRRHLIRPGREVRVGADDGRRLPIGGDSKA